MTWATLCRGIPASFFLIVSLVIADDLFHLRVAEVP